MTEEGLKYISDLMDELEIPYAFIEFNVEENPPPSLYFTGEYQETDEDEGYQETTFILNGFCRGSWLDLENAKKTIMNVLTKTTILENKTGIAISYSNALVIPTGDAEFKRLQINLNIKEWKVSENEY